MQFKLSLLPGAEQKLKALKLDISNQKRFKAVCKALEYLAKNPKHPSLNTHEFTSLTRKSGIKIFEAYAENKTPAAYRVFWHYGPSKREITIISITPHL